jgi:hypothetical protein
VIFSHVQFQSEYHPLKQADRFSGSINPRTLAQPRGHHNNSRAQNTGPSVQVSLYDQSFPISGGLFGSGLRCRMQQLWQVPMPQAIARSAATWHSIPRDIAMSATRFIISSGPQL